MRSGESVEIRIAELAQAIISGTVGIVEGSRQLVQLMGRLGERDDELFSPIIAVESETDDLPVGEARLHWSQEALRKKDVALDAYICGVRAEVLKACEALVREYSS